MEISVIIPTFQGAKRIENAVVQLNKQEFKDLEVIVVVDGSKDNTLEILEQIETIYPCRVISQSNLGRAAARNRGAAEASGQILFFLDDDVILEDSCIGNHVLYQKQINGGLVTGSQLELERDTTSDFQSYRTFLSRKWTSRLPKNRKLDKNELFLSASNFSIPKEIFSRLGGFDSRLKDAEDFELGVRAMKMGYSVYYLAGATGFHNDITDIRMYIKRLRQYRKAHLSMLEINPDVNDFFEANKYEVGKFSVKFLFFSLFSFTFWINLVDKEGLNFLPKEIRFKLYDWITTAFYLYFPEKALT